MASNQITRGNASTGALTVREDLTVDGNILAPGVMMASGPITLGSAAGAGMGFAWANPLDGAIVVDRVIVSISDASAQGNTMDIGVADDATTSADNLIDGASTQSTLLISSDGDTTPENNGPQSMTADQYVTCTLSAAVTSFAATAYIYWHAV